jgi:hypothetical protein
MHKHIAAGSHHNCVLAGHGIGERDRPCRRQGTRGTGFLGHVVDDGRSLLNSTKSAHRGRGVAATKCRPRRCTTFRSSQAVTGCHGESGYSRGYPTLWISLRLPDRPRGSSEVSPRAFFLFSVDFEHEVPSGGRSNALSVKRSPPRAREEHPRRHDFSRKASCDSPPRRTGGMGASVREYTLSVVSRKGAAGGACLP